MKKNAFSLFLTVLLALGLLPSAALAQENQVVSVLPPATDSSNISLSEVPDSTGGEGAGESNFNAVDELDIPDTSNKDTDANSITEIEGDDEPQTSELDTVTTLVEDEELVVLDTEQGAVSFIGRGTSDDPLQIHTGQQLYSFAECFNADTLPANLPTGNDLYLTLMNDIDISSYPNWMPIGSFYGLNDNNNNPFQGSFTSAGTNIFTISGLSINTRILQASDNLAYGLFGFVEGGTLERITISVSNVSVDNNSGAVSELDLGGLAGYLSLGAKVDACSASGQVLAVGKTKNHAGGLVGYALSGTTITNSSATGAVSASGGVENYAGGLAGYAASIVNSYATGSVSTSGGGGTSYGFAGGLAGTADAITCSYATGSALATGSEIHCVGGLAGKVEKTISNSYATGSASASGGKTNYAGGLTGETFSSVTNSYATGSASASNATGKNYAGGLTGSHASGSAITNSVALGQNVSASGGTSNSAGKAVGYYDSSTPPLIEKVYAWVDMSVVGSDMDSLDGEPANYASLTGTAAPTPPNLWTNTIASFSTSPWVYDSERTQDPYALPILSNLPGATAQNNNLPFWIQGSTPPTDKIYRIYTAEDLAAFRDQVNAGTDFEGCTVYLMNDIDISAYPNWEPIGLFKSNTNYKPFRGTFKSEDGEQNVIRGLSIEAHDVKTSSNNYHFGLFGYTQNAQLERIKVESVQISVSILDNDLPAYVNVGALVGNAFNSTVTACSASGMVTASRGSGIVVGGLTGSASSINNSYAIGTATASDAKYTFAGGLAGFATTIQNSYATGTATASGGSSNNHAGGLAGYAHQITSSYATGSAAASGGNYAYAGGLVGYVDDISNSYATGNATASGGGFDSFAGGLAGVINDTVSNSVALGQQVNGGNTGSGRIVGSMVGPTINCYAWEDMQVNGTTVDGTVNKHGTDATYEMLTGNNTPTVSNLWITSPLVFDKSPWVYDTRTADPFALPILEDMPEGAQNNNLPFWIKGGDETYYISTASDLAAFRDRVNAGQDFKSEIVYLMNNIDLSDYPNWEPIGYSANEPFNGTFTSYGTDGTGAPNTYTISGLTIDANPLNTDMTADRAFGLFGQVNDGTITHIKVVNAQIYVDAEDQDIDLYVGILAGRLQGIAIDLCSASGKVQVSGSTAANTKKRTAAGGLVGSINDTVLTNSCADGSVTVSDGDYSFAGGLVGQAVESSEIVSSRASGNVNASKGGQYTAAGGLVGYSDSADGSLPTSISQSSATGSATVSLGRDYNLAGGLVGFVDTDTVIEYSYATGSATAEDGEYSNAGGLIGRSTKGSGSVVSSCFATGAVRAQDSVEGVMAGGLIGFSSNPVSDSYATGQVNSLESLGDCYCYAGGLIGYSDENSSITNTYATGSVVAMSTTTEDATKGIYAGGLIGRAGNCSISNSVSLAQKVSVVGPKAEDPPLAGRIVGLTATKTTLANNYAWEGMVVSVDGVPVTINEADKGTASPHGMDVLGGDALSALWWTLPAAEDGPAFDTSDATGAWDTYDTALPLLKNPKGTANTPFWLMIFPTENTELTLTGTPLSFARKNASTTGTVNLTAELSSSVTPAKVFWETSDSMIILSNESNTGAIATIPLDTVGTYTISAALLGWPDIKDEVTIYVNGDLGEVGTATITGESYYGDTLKADFILNDPAPVPAPTGISYQWLVNGTPIPGATTDTLVLSEASWIGQDIQLQVSSTNYSDYALSAATQVAKSHHQGTALHPALHSVTSTSIQLVEVAGYEYQILPAGTHPSALSSARWQSSPHFTGLNSGTAYDLYQRIAETSTVAASTHAGPLKVSTAAAATDGDTTPSSTAAAATDGGIAPKTGDTLVWPLLIVGLCILGSAGTFVANRHRYTRIK